MGDPYQCDYAKPPSLFSLVYPTQRCTIGIPEPQASRHRVKLLSLMIDRGSCRIASALSKICRDLDMYLLVGNLK